MTAYSVTVTDGFRTPDVMTGVRAQMVAIADGIGSHDAAIYHLGVVVTEMLRLTDTQIPNQKGQLSLVEQILAHDAIARGLPLSLTDGIGMQLVQTAAQLVSVIEKLGLNPVLVPALHYKVSVADQVAFVDALVRFIGGSIVDGLQVVETLSGVALKPGSITDGVGINPVLNPQMVFRAIAADTLDVTDAELIKMIFGGEIIEAIELAAAYLGPNGSITTWAMNTRTAAVTEYTNYAFNSFARMGNIYLGASKNGLYELTGDNDAGTSIIADLKSGLAQFAGVHLASFKAAYIAARGGGSYVLRIFTGDGQRYDYSVTADSMKTARIDMGKGIRARYFAFELISSGQDFDLESLEFVPLVAKRRV